MHLHNLEEGDFIHDANVALFNVGKFYVGASVKIVMLVVGNGYVRKVINVDTNESENIGGVAVNYEYVEKFV